MVSKKKCSSYGRELAMKHTTQSAIGLNACRWERRDEDTADYDVIDVPPTPVKRMPIPKVKKLSAAAQKRVARSKEMEFVWAPRKVQPKSKNKIKSKPIPSNLRSGLTNQQIQQLQSYNGSKRIKQRIEIYLKRGLSFSDAKKRAISRDKTEVVPVTKKKRGTGRGGKRFIFDEAGVG